MALSLEDAANVFRKADAYLTSHKNDNNKQASPVARAALRGFQEYWMGAKGAGSLQFVPYSEAQADDADGTGLLDAASTIYFWYTIKENSATDNTAKIFESATVDTTSTEQGPSISLLLANQEAFLVYPDGYPQATGLTITQHTTPEGSTDGSDGGDGFFIVGAA